MMKTRHFLSAVVASNAYRVVPICIVCLQCGHGRRASSGRRNRGSERTEKGEVTMLICPVVVCAAAFVAVVTVARPIQALTMQECSTKYKAAQAAGTLKGTKWNDFRKAECGPDASAAAPATVPTLAPAAGAPTSRTTAAQPKTAPAAAGDAVFPTAVSPKYSSESAGKARMHTCLDQYNTNKASDANGGLVWIKKGGGYYSECNRHLKG